MGYAPKRPGERERSILLDPLVGKRPIHCAALNRHVEALQTLIEHGAEINCQDDLGQTPLMIAIQRRGLEAATYLCRCGADPFVQDKRKKSLLDNETYLLRFAEALPPDIVFPVSQYGETLLHRAVRNGFAQALSNLLVKGASAMMCDNKGRTPLHLAVRIGSASHQECARILLTFAPTSVNIQDKSNGRTALHKAVRNRRSDWVAFLLGAGADPSICDHKNNSVVDEALLQNTQNPIPEILQLLSASS